MDVTNIINMLLIWLWRKRPRGLVSNLDFICIVDNIYAALMSPNLQLEIRKDQMSVRALVSVFVAKENILVRLKLLMTLSS